MERALATCMKQSDLPLVRPIGVRLPPEALRFIARVAQLFPGSERDLILVRLKPTSPTPRGGEIGNFTQREKVQPYDHNAASDQN